MTRPLFGMTTYQPWARLLAERVKGVENREWRPPAEVLRGYVAIHAGSRRDYAEWCGAAQVAQRAGALDRVPWLERLLTTDYRERIRFMNSAADYSAIVAVGRIRRIETEPPKGDPWWFGPVGWRFVAVVPVVPIGCSGAKGFWRIEGGLLERVRLAYGQARKGATHDRRE